MATMANVERLQSLLDEYSTKSQVPTDEVKKLYRRLRRIKARLVDAEEILAIWDASVKHWLDDLRDVAYDAEDAIEEFTYELMWNQLVSEEGNHDLENTREGRGVEQIHVKIEEINDRIDEIFEDSCALKLCKTDEPRRKQHMLEQSLPTSSLLGESRVYGRDDEKDWLVDSLLYGRGVENVSVVSIVGMGGIGKTTLAQLVYNDDKVQNHFVARSWVYVSDDFEVGKLTKKILEELTRAKVEHDNFNLLQEELHKTLKGQRFLLVLDDLWNESWGQWEALWRPLTGGAEGSKVLVTTRNEGVSRISGAVSSHFLKSLSEGDSWSLFAHCAFGCKNPSDFPNLASIGEQILDKCNGMPLAIKTLGGLLFNKIDEDEWNDILNSEIWELPEKNNDILPALKLSYQHLPSPMKPCFAVCAVFPKNYWFDERILTEIWMAQGYVSVRKRKSMEDVGREYFNDLVQRSFLVRENVGVGTFTMHGLIHDLALSIWGNECLTLGGGKIPGTSRKVRHLSFGHDADMEGLLCSSTCKFQYLRTVYNRYWRTRPYNFSLDDMFRNMRYLRMLDLGFVKIDELPDSIGNLKYLRHMRIWGSHSFKRFPESLCNLLNLQFLEVHSPSNETYLEELPGRLGNLVNLRVLDLGSCDHLSMMPRGIGRLTQLRTLRTFVVGDRGVPAAAGIEELTHLNGIQGELKILFKSVNNNDSWVSREADILKDKKGLETLCVEWDSDLRWDWDGLKRQEEFLELIQPHTSIQELKLLRYLGSRLPEWMGDPLYSALSSIRLWGLENCRHLPAFGQLPSLKSLTVGYMRDVGILVRAYLFGDVASPFPSLEKLVLYNLEIEGFLFIGTEEVGAFPRLRVLNISSCHELEYVKLRHLSALRKLKIRNCSELTTLDYCHDLGTVSPLSAKQAVDNMHIPRVHTMDLSDCPELGFPPTATAEQQLPQSLRKFNFLGSHRLSEWVKRHIDKVAGVANLGLNFYWDPQTSPHSYLSKVEDVDMYSSFATRPHLILSNVEDVREAGAADLCSAGFIRKLEIRWDQDQHRLSSRPKEAAQVLENLCPGRFLEFSEELVIQGYHGRKFPTWVCGPAVWSTIEWVHDHNSFGPVIHCVPDIYHILRKMTLSDCVHCERLPPLGQLPSLEELHISNMYKVQHVGSELEGDAVDHGAFPKLRVLTISNFPELRTFQLPALPDSVGDISPSAGGGSMNPLTCLERLLVEDCPQLISIVGIHGICSMRRLVLRRCPKLDFSHEVQLPPKLEYANIRGCSLLLRWCQGDRISHLRGMCLDGELMFSDGKNVRFL